jgi:aldehyde dehydrogenase (NAD+)
MIDIADFAVGQSRMLYGLRCTPSARATGCSSSGTRSASSASSARSTSRSRCGPGTRSSAICGNVTCGSRRRRPRSARRRAAHLQRVLEATAFRRFSSCSWTTATNWRPLRRGRRVNLVLVHRLDHGRPQRRQARCERGSASHARTRRQQRHHRRRDANLDLAVPAIVFGAVGTAGQRCTTTRRVFVHESRSTSSSGETGRAYRQVRIGDPLERRHADGPADRRGRCSATSPPSRRPSRGRRRGC